MYRVIAGSDILYIVGTTCIMFFCRYGVLLTQPLCEVSDREQTVALLDLVGAEDEQYQLGMTKVLNRTARCCLEVFTVHFNSVQPCV